MLSRIIQEETSELRTFMAIKTRVFLSSAPLERVTEVLATCVIAKSSLTHYGIIVRKVLFEVYGDCMQRVHRKDH